MLIQVKICKVHRSLTSHSRMHLVSKASGFLAKTSTLASSHRTEPSSSLTFACRYHLAPYPLFLDILSPCLASA